MIATITEQSATREMVEAGEEQISELQSHISAIDTQLADIQHELDGLHESHLAREQALSASRAKFSVLDDTYRQVTSYAKLAHGKPTQQKATKEVSAAKQHWQAAKKELEQLASEDTDAEQQALAGEQECTKQAYLLRSERETRLAEVDAVSRGLSKAKDELGRETYADILRAYQEKQRETDSRAEQLVSAQVAQYEFHQAALQELSPWPDLQKEIARLVPPDDATARIINATLFYMDVLIQEGLDVRLSLPGMPWHVRDVLYVREDEQFSPGKLSERRRRLEQVQLAYRHLVESEQE